MATKKVKGDSRKMLDKECDISSEDQISHLPDSLIHHIFSFLPTAYLVRMSIVSKRWREMWVSTPFLYFDDLFWTYRNRTLKIREKVLKFMTNYLSYRKQSMKIPDTFVSSFRFDTQYDFTSKSIHMRRLDDWLNFVVKSKVKELDLHVKNYCLPQFVLNGSSLTLLKLDSMKLVVPSLSTFPSLKVLSLSSVESDAKSLENLISRCPIIEKLHLSGDRLGPIDFVISETLTSLSLSLDLTDQWFNDLVSRLPFLERLALRPYKQKNISIHSHSLKCVFIDICNWYDDVKLTIATPKLVFLYLECTLRLVMSVEAPNLLEAKLNLNGGYMRKAQHMALVRLFSNLNAVKKMVLSIANEEAVIFLKTVRKKCPPPLPNLESLKVKVWRRRDKSAEMQDALYWCAPSLKTLDIRQKYGSDSHDHYKLFSRIV